MIHKFCRSVRSSWPTVLLLLAVFLFSNSSTAQTIVFEGKNVLIGQQLQYLDDTSGKYSINQVADLPFKASNVETPNFGLSNHVYWLKFTIDNRDSMGQVLLEVAYPLLEYCELYTINGDKIIEQAIYSDKPFASRSIKHENFIFDLRLRPGQTKTYYLRARGNEQVMFPLIIRNGKGLFESSLITESITGIHIGILLVMFLFNLFIYFSTYEKSYFYYVLFILMMGFTHITINGYGFKYLWPNLPWINHYGFIAFPAVGGVCTILFFRNFLNTRERVPLLDKILNILIVLYVLATITRLAGGNVISYRIMDVAGLISTVFGISVAARLSLQNYRPAKFFLLAWTFFLVGIILFVMRNLNILPYNNFTNYTMQAGTDIVVILLSIALADKINVLKREEEAAREQALRISLLNEKIIREQNVFLEKKVEERTVELKKTNNELTDTLTKLKDAQAQLIDSEKMASLGQLTAGIAHEINNPINFVSANIRPLKRDIADLLEMIAAYDEVRDVETMELLQQKLKLIDRKKEELDIEYLKEELDLLLKGMEDGASRTVEIVKGLKIFSRVDESDLNSVNINEGIESTLVILNNQMGSKMNLTKELNNIPAIECYAGKLNQVFMNILTNSIHAVHDEKNNGKTPSIWVKTGLLNDDTVAISIKDNGMGMKPEVKAKIFEPFFTTKEVGKGTGLGLSIVFKIIEAHNGAIDVLSEEGVGTEFIIKLPVKRK